MDPISSHLLAKGDIVAEQDELGLHGTVIDVLPFKKPIYVVQLGGLGGTVVHIRASLTKKGRAGKQFVRVSKEDGGRWAMVPETLFYVAVSDVVPATQESIVDCGTKSCETTTGSNLYCKCKETHPPNEQCDKA